MATNEWGIVYGTANPHIRRHIFTDHEGHLDDPMHVGPGEAMVRVPHDPTWTSEAFHAHIIDQVCQHAGVDKLVPISFVVVDPTGLVIEHHVGDKDLAWEPSPGHSHVTVMHGANNSVGIGHTYDRTTGKFTPPHFVQPIKKKPSNNPIVNWWHKIFGRN